MGGGGSKIPDLSFFGLFLFFGPPRGPIRKFLKGSLDNQELSRKSGKPLGSGNPLYLLSKQEVFRDLVVVIHHCHSDCLSP